MLGSCDRPSARFSRRHAPCNMGGQQAYEEMRKAMKKTFAIVALFVASLAGTALAGDAYKLSVGKASGAVNKSIKAEVKVEAQGAYHVNKEFPHKLTLEAPAGVTLEESKLTKEKAAKFTDKELTFKVGITASKAGKTEVKGTLKFGVCEGDKACELKSENIVIAVDAK